MPVELVFLKSAIVCRLLSASGWRDQLPSTFDRLSWLLRRACAFCQVSDRCDPRFDLVLSAPSVTPRIIQSPSVSLASECSENGSLSNKNLYSGQQWHLCIPLLETPGNHIVRRDARLEKRLRGGFSIWGDYEVRSLLEVLRIPILTISRSKTFGTERFKPRHGECPLNTRWFLHC